MWDVRTVPKSIYTLTRAIEWRFHYPRDINHTIANAKWSDSFKVPDNKGITGSVYINKKNDSLIFPTTAIGFHTSKEPLLVNSR